MPKPRVRFQIRWLMNAVAALAVLLSLPTPVLMLLLLPAIVAALILLPTALVTRGRRVEVAFWAMALHPLVFLAWLAAWRFLLDPRTLYPRDSGWYFTLILLAPYLLALVSRWYLLAFLAVGGPLATSRFSGRALAIPLVLMIVVWFSTWAVLAWDPFQMSDWFWDLDTAPTAVLQSGDLAVPYTAGSETRAEREQPSDRDFCVRGRRSDISLEGRGENANIAGLPTRMEPSSLRN